MSVQDIIREIHAAGYTSANLRKWQFSPRLYQKHLDLYLSRLHYHLRACDPIRVLDAGCGEGIVCGTLQRRGWQSSWTGCDASADALRMAGKVVPSARWVRASVSDLSFADRSFDLVLCSEVLEHLANPQRALQEFARVGCHWLLLSVPVEPWFRILTRASRLLHLGGDPGHVNFWTPAAFRQFVGQSGKLVHWERTTVYQIAVVELPQPCG